MQPEDLPQPSDSPERSDRAPLDAPASVEPRPGDEGKPIGLSSVGVATGAPEGRLERLRRVIGLVALPAFLLGHLATQAAASGGIRAHEAALRPRLPFGVSLAVSIGFVFVPLVVHGALGLRRIRALGLRTGPDGTPTDATTRIARGSAVALGLFVVAHLAHVGLLGSSDPERAIELPSRLAGDLSRTVGPLPLAATGYVVGVAAAALHASSGIYLSLLRAGRLDDPRARRNVGAMCVLLGAILFVFGWNTVLVLATGVGIIG